MASKLLLPPPRHFYIVWRRFRFSQGLRASLRYRIKLTQDFTQATPITISLNGYPVSLSPLSNRFGSWLMLVYGHYTRFVHRSQLSQRGFKRLSRAIQALRRS
jgi:hypothetical protein